MNKKCFLKGIAAMVIAVGAASCSHETELYEVSNTDKLKNASERLGVSVDPNQDWNMTATARARVAVNGDYSESYTVKVYSNDPLIDKKGYILTKGTVESGQVFEQDFQYASATTQLVVGLTSSKGFTTYKTATIQDGILSTSFGSSQAAASRRAFRSQASPAVPHISTVPDAAYAQSYLNGATEPNSANVVDDYDNSSWGNTGKCYQIDWNDPQQVADKDYFFSLPWDQAVEWALEHHPDWVAYQKDENYVTKFKITGNWSDNIDVLGRRPTSVYISGTWTLSNGNGQANEYYVIGQTVNANSVIIVASGGTLVIPKYTKLDLANEARLVVMPGGTVTGEGEIAVHNGNADGLEGYNGGTIDVGSFDNNYGKFYNYGSFKCTTLKGGAGLSNFYNHGNVHITMSGEANGTGGGNYYTPNTRIFNACQWYCENDMKAYVIENASGSYFYVGGELNMSDGTDGTAVNSYVALADGALVRVGTLSSNNCSWQGPTSGYAVVETGGITYLNWTGLPITQGYFINNIAVSVDDQTIGQGQGQGTDTYIALRDFVMNGHGATGNVFDPIGKETIGNGGAVMVEKYGANVNIPRSENFVAGVSGCTPGYEGVPGGNPDPSPTPTPEPDPTPDPAPTPAEETNSSWCYAFEDTPLGDYDMNDVVLKVKENDSDASKLDVTLCCTGASFDLYVHLGDKKIFGGVEVHRVLGQAAGSFVNTGKGPDTDPVTVTVNKPAGFTFGSGDFFWIESPAVPGGVHIATAGTDPHGIVIPADWEWPTEFTNIKEAYPNFVKFAADAATTDKDAQEWYKKTDGNPVAGKVYKK